MILDATASNRGMWKCKTPPGAIFLDRNVSLWRSPDIFGSNEQLPFRSGVFQLVIYDPPHDWNDPSSKFGDPTNGSYYGGDLPKRAVIKNLATAPQEFLRVLGESGRLVFKWNERRLGIWKVMIFFKEFHELYRKTVKNGKNWTHWVTFTRRPIQ